MKLYLGAADGPLHPQHISVMGNPDEWTFIDKYIDNGRNKLWDAETLDEVEDGTVEMIYASHLAEHFSHRKIQKVFKNWYYKLQKGGQLILNVPDMEWACYYFLLLLQEEREGKDTSSHGYYHHSIDHKDHQHDFLQIFFGSHENDGEYHKCGFTKESLQWLLKDFSKVEIVQAVEAHDMGCLLVRATK